MAKWHPIETAEPYEHVLVWDGTCVIDAWLEDDRWYIFRREHGNGQVAYWLDEDPTHWMPLPLPPGDDEEEAA